MYILTERESLCLWHMENDMKRLAAVVLTLILTFSLTGCRAVSETGSLPLPGPQEQGPEYVIPGKEKELLPLQYMPVSDEELEFLTGTDDMHKALPRLLVGNVKLVLFTLGKNGASALTAAHEAHVDGLPGKAVDTTGAGDGFAGSFLWMLHRKGVGRDDLAGLSEKTLLECLRFSNAFCTRSVQKRGAIASYPTREEVLADLQSE